MNPDVELLIGWQEKDLFVATTTIVDREAHLKGAEAAEARAEKHNTQYTISAPPTGPSSALNAERRSTVFGSLARKESKVTDS